MGCHFFRLGLELDVDGALMSALCLCKFRLAGSESIVCFLGSCHLALQGLNGPVAIGGKGWQICRTSFPMANLYNCYLQEIEVSFIQWKVFSIHHIFHWVVWNRNRKMQTCYFGWGTSKPLHCHLPGKTSRVSRWDLWFLTSSPASHLGICSLSPIPELQAMIFHFSNSMQSFKNCE